eukprot:1177626-Prymnesium_polylepis.1
MISHASRAHQPRRQTLHGGTKTPLAFVEAPIVRLQSMLGRKLDVGRSEQNVTKPIADGPSLYVDRIGFENRRPRAARGRRP